MGTGDEEDVVALLCELDGVFLAETVRGAGYKSPGALLAKFGELRYGSVEVFGIIVSCTHTDWPGRMNREAMRRQKDRILYDTQKTPMKAATLVAGAAQGSIGFKLSIVGVSEVV